MAINEAIRARAFRSALGIVRQESRSATEGSVARRLQADYDPFHRQPFAVWQQVARSAIRTNRVGREVEDAGIATVNPRDLPVDPSIAADEPTYRYRVVIVATNPATGDSFDTAVNVDSSRPLSYDQIREFAEQDFRKNQLERDYQARIDRMGQAPLIDVFVISAGRASRS